jgi:LacI family transcriptional regulator
MITLKDIAEQVGVSVETVSRVLNGKNKEIWPSAVRRGEEIRRIAKKAGFRPNSAARIMQRGRFNQIACVVTRFQVMSAGRDLDRSYLEAATVALAQQRYSVIFEPFLLDWQTMDLVETPRLFSELTVDGILGIAEAGTDFRSVDRRLSRLGGPTVWVNRDPVEGIPCVVADEFTNGYILARHFIEKGHRQIGYIGYDVGPYSVPQRYRGVLKALREAGVNTEHAILKQDPKENQVRFTKRYFDKHRSVTALVCYNGQFYDAALHEAAHLGIRVPVDMTLGYFGSLQNTPLDYSSVLLEIPKKQMTDTAVKILLDLVDGKPAPQHIPPVPGTIFTERQD